MTELTDLLRNQNQSTQPASDRHQQTSFRVEVTYNNHHHHLDHSTQSSTIRYHQFDPGITIQDMRRKTIESYDMLK
ncbi:hypothetical protein DPMN_038280 [Dreissena polymorpha]|uniref:Uncharacterized protein n=1 Tax=Dreissena polymorpha TaxID=45954 RepID=A0A9D4MGS3_DREPO|nr:hypothetical protein DPMN_112466 [Dreissena polymorpha]KAH3875021.1 hypothetical protein DPMN_038280 [Dreissena polymorpha]